MATIRRIWEDEEIEPTQRLWRYFKVNRFLQALRTSCLYFPSACEFSDPFEGATAVLRHDWPVDPRFAEPEQLERAFAALRPLTKITCWHRADYESDAMWRSYAAEHKGLAVCTTVDRLHRALKPYRIQPQHGEEAPFAGSVRYVDLHAERLRVGMERRFFYKHRPFEWEREYRLIISVRDAQEWGVDVPEKGILVGFDRPTLIERVWLGPKMNPKDRERVTKACIAAGLGDRISTSSLLGQPRYS
jgi:hypothetical protein